MSSCMQGLHVICGCLDYKRVFWFHFGITENWILAGSLCSPQVSLKKTVMVIYLLLF